jgi:tight adherence protein B
LRAAFTQLVTALEGGQSLEGALGTFQAKLSNRSADLFTLLILLSSGFGVTGQNQIWKELSVRTRQEQATLGLILAKQNWTIGTAKLALLAPWLIAALLMQQGQNRSAFENPTGSAILLTGLLLSLFAYFLVNQLGAIRQTPRVLYAT